MKNYKPAPAMAFCLLMMCAAALFMMCAAALSSQTVKERGKEMLEKADRMLFPDEGSGFIAIESTDDTGKELNWSLEAYKKGQKKQTVVWVSPKSTRNDVGLRSERTIYHKALKATKPSIFNYLSLFLESAFSWGDIIAADFAGDYAAQSIETVNEGGTEYTKLVLKPTGKDMYDRIDVWIETATNRSSKRVYYTASGEVMKISEYSDFTGKGGEITGYTLTMIDDMLGMKSVATFSDLKQTGIPDFMFDPNNIGRIHATRK